MEPKDASKPAMRARVGNTLPVRQPGEREIFTIKRHPIARVRIYALCLFVTLLATGLAFMLASGALNDGSGEQDFTVVGAVFLAVGAIATVFALLITKINAGNSWTLTDDSLTQVEQTGLFKRHSSQLALDNVEDVTSIQNGLLPELLNYGQLRVETAGEQGKFIFNFCPNPNYYAAQILTAREAFEHHDREIPPESAAATPREQPLPPAAVDIDSYEVPDGKPGA